MSNAESGKRTDTSSPRLLDGATYHNAASHTSSEGLRERFSKLDPNWNKKPGQSPENAGIK